MIRKLKIKFIMLAGSSLFALLLIIVAGMNILNYNSVVMEADSTLSVLSKNKGVFPDNGWKKNKPFSFGMSPETPYESRYFSVVINTDGEIINTETRRIISVDDEAASQYAKSVLQKGSGKGFIDNFRYIVTSEGEDDRIIFLDCGRKLETYLRFLIISVLMAVAGFAIIFLVIVFFAGRIIRPIAVSYEKQKRFITDAGHEIKTPLTIISANADLLEMDIGNNESIEDIKKQAKRLTGLTNDLICLARMEEAENTMQMIDFPVSEIISGAAAPFKALAKAGDRELICSVQPMLSMKGNDKAISQLVYILLDNAIKYSPERSVIRLDFLEKNKNLRLVVSNSTETAMEREMFARVFDRFYRADLSRNPETGGYGIGLSSAKAIVTAHGGKIKAGERDGSGGYSFVITAVFPG